MLSSFTTAYKNKLSPVCRQVAFTVASTKTMFIQSCDVNNQKQHEKMSYLKFISAFSCTLSKLLTLWLRNTYGSVGCKQYWHQNGFFSCHNIECPEGYTTSPFVASVPFSIPFLSLHPEEGCMAVLGWDWHNWQQTYRVILISTHLQGCHDCRKYCNNAEFHYMPACSGWRVLERSHINAGRLPLFLPSPLCSSQLCSQLQPHVSPPARPRSKQEAWCVRKWNMI